MSDRLALSMVVCGYEKALGVGETIVGIILNSIRN